MASKEPEVEELFTHTVERFYASDDTHGQMSLWDTPKIETVRTEISAHYVPSIKVVRLFVGGGSGGWRKPLPMEGGRYEAIVTAQIDMAGAMEMLPNFETPEEAAEDWKAKMRSRTDRMRESEGLGDSPSPPEA